MKSTLIRATHVVAIVISISMTACTANDPLEPGCAHTMRPPEGGELVCRDRLLRGGEHRMPGSDSVGG